MLLCGTCGHTRNLDLATTCRLCGVGINVTLARRAQKPRIGYVDVRRLPQLLKSHGLDFSPASVVGVDLLLDRVWGLEPVPGAEPDEAVAWMVACYLGEVVVQSCGGRWVQNHQQPEKTEVVAGPARLLPMHEVRLRHDQGARHRLEAVVAGVRAQVDAKRPPAGPPLLGVAPPSFEPRAFLAQADSWRKRGDAPAALILCDRAVALDRDHGDAWLLRGQLLLELARPAEALLCFVRGTELLPHVARSWAGKAAAHRALGEVEPAIACLDQAIERAVAPDPLRAERQALLALRPR